MVEVYEQTYEQARDAYFEAEIKRCNRRIAYWTAQSRKADWYLAGKSEDMLTELWAVATYLADARAALQTVRKPLTLEEFNALETPCPVWVEYKDRMKGLTPKIFWYTWKSNTSGKEFAMFDKTHDPIRQYGRSWRCWRGKPTEAERAAAEWRK